MSYFSFNNSPCYVMSEVSLKRFYFALFDGLTLKTLKLAFICFCIQNKLFKYIYMSKLKQVVTDTMHKGAFPR